MQIHRLRQNLQANGNRCALSSPSRSFVIFLVCLALAAIQNLHADLAIAKAVWTSNLVPDPATGGKGVLYTDELLAGRSGGKIALWLELVNPTTQASPPQIITAEVWCFVTKIDVHGSWSSDPYLAWIKTDNIPLSIGSIEPSSTGAHFRTGCSKVNTEGVSQIAIKMNSPHGDLSSTTGGTFLPSIALH